MLPKIRINQPIEIPHSRWPHWRLTCTALFHALFGYSLFFDSAYLNQIDGWIKNLAKDSIYTHYGVSITQSEIEWIWSTTSAAYLLGGIVGASNLTFPAEKFGRRNTVMVLKNFVLFASVAFSILSKITNSIELLIIGRFLSGIATIHTCFIVVFLAECSPTDFRGIVPTLCHSVGIGFWAVFGSFVGLPDIIVSEQTWHYGLLVPVLPALVHVLTTPWVPQSIKYAFISQKNEALSRKASRFYHGGQAQFRDIRADMDMEAEANVSPTVTVAGLNLTLTAPQFRWPLFLCLLIEMMVPCSGYDVVLFYSAGLMKKLGVTPSRVPLYTALFLRLPTLAVSTTAALLVEQFGRRPLLLAGVALELIGVTSLTLITPASHISEFLTKLLSLIGCAFVIYGYTIGPGLLGYLMPGELAPQASRSLTSGLATSTAWTSGLILVFVIPPLHQLIGSYCLIPLSVVMAVGFVLLYKCLPESKGKSVFKIVDRWMPARKQGTILQLEIDKSYLMPDATPDLDYLMVDDDD